VAKLAEKQKLGTMEGKQMADQSTTTQTKAADKKTTGLSLDGWAVAIALLLAGLVRLGVLKHVAW
jgi:hypothetical protein